MTLPKTQNLRRTSVLKPTVFPFNHLYCATFTILYRSMFLSYKCFITNTYRDTTNRINRFENEQRYGFNHQLNMPIQQTNTFDQQSNTSTQNKTHSAHKQTHPTNNEIRPPLPTQSFSAQALVGKEACANTERCNRVSLCLIFVFLVSHAMYGSLGQAPELVTWT